jgi:hypothetical protein
MRSPGSADIRVRCFYGTGGASWRDEGLHGSSSLKLCVFKYPQERQPITHLLTQSGSLDPLFSNRLVNDFNGLDFL